MNITISSAPLSQITAEALVVAVLDAGENKDPKPVLQTSDPAINAIAADLIASKEITGKIFETTLVHKPQGLAAKRLLFVGGGKAKNFSSVELRKVAGVALRAMKPKQIKSFAFALPGAADVDAVRSTVEGFYVGNFDANYYHSEKKDQQVADVTVVVPANTDLKPLEAAVEQGRIIGQSQNFTRDLVNEPGNYMTPTILAERARKMSEETGLKFEAYGADKIKELKMGAFWSVAQGSDEEPRLIVMRYEPANAPKDRVLGLVGKGITFDSGGISLKPGDGMEKMKYDMAGGAAMIGAMRAIALLKPNVRVISIVCATENMPSGKAQKPGDVQIAMSGKSIEIINTDAEGRLVLADGLHYARQLGATHLVDAATLTGACVIALGYANVGAFCNNDDYWGQFETALKRSGEKMWRMPVDSEYSDLIKSDIADIKNTGGRWGGAISAAMFLKEFVEETPWLHLDIAGTAWIEDSKPWIAKGPSGVAVRSLVEFAEQMSKM
jgi:leucyl aminopeptidase